MAKILVTGAQGLLGNHLVPHLKKCGHDVVGHSRSGQTEVNADLTDAGQVSVILDKTMPECIVNLVALTNVDECERHPHSSYVTNVRVIENLTSWMRNHAHTCHLVQISTDQVYDGIGPHKEDDITISNYYGFSKYAGELVAGTVSSTILRTNFFGRSRCTSRASLSDWLVESLAFGRAITVFDDIFFSPLSLPRLVEFIELSIGKRKQGLFNLGSKEGMSKADFAFILADVLGLQTKCMTRGASDSIKLMAYRPKDMRMDSCRFEDVFGINLPTLREEIESLKGAYSNDAR